MTTQPTQNNHTGGERDNRNLLPLWRICGTIRLLTPLSIGTGISKSIQIQQQVGSPHDRHVIAVTLDHRGLPYIAASSFKGALNALAQDCNLSEAHRSMFFGVVQADKTKPGAVEFCNLMLASAPQRDSALPHWDTSSQTANVEHVVRNRDYGTAQEQLLFLEQTVVPESEFTFECTVRGVNEEAIRDLLGLLALAGKADSPLRLGAGKASDNGRISWSLTDVQLLDKPQVQVLWQSLLGQTSTTPLQLWAAPISKLKKVTPSTLTVKPDQWLALPALALNFHSPFLVYHSVPKPDQQVDRTGEARQVVPRANHAGRAILPTDSLHGALRSQAERILHTVDIQVVEGYKLGAAADVKAAAKLDLAAILFGAPGWGSVLRISDFVVQGEVKTLTHEMLAIDRLTGGGKDGAKFTIEALDCPQLAGQIALDLRRLALVDAECPGVAAKALGLLAHVLRDLDEGDLPLGYGAAKGYGRCRSNTVAVLSQALASAKSSLAPSLAAVLQAFASAAGNSPTAVSMQLNNPQPLPVPIPTKAAGDFHNPYLFIPFGQAKPDDKRLPWLSHDDIGKADSHHRHSRYASNAWHGRLLCRLTTTTPMFIGAGDVPGTSDPKQKQNFKLNGEIALPATSLRGMLSSLHESITGSALRVMDERHYSVRAATAQALKKKGTIVKRQHLRGDGTTVLVWKVADADTQKCYLITPQVKARLEMLCDERTEQSDKRGTESPEPELKPKDVARNNDPAKFGNKIRFVEGQRVFFDLAADEETITELAYSQIWRKIVAVDNRPWLTTDGLSGPELSTLTAKRQQLSPTELLFGYVEVNPADKKASDKQPITRAFAAKVHVGFARPTTKVKLLPVTTLKILASPKPPSPAMYLQPKNGRQEYVSKKALVEKPALYIFKGTKTYLHALRTRDDAQARVRPLDNNGNCAGERMPWQTAHPRDQDTLQQKVRITPIAEGNTFVFEVDFNNLSQAELESLCACLCPDASYEHKLGMGKPLGLGSVKIEMAGLYLLDRAARYRQTDFAKHRYASVWQNSALPQPLAGASVPHLQTEVQNLQTKVLAGEYANAVSPYQLATQQMRELQKQAPAVFNAILLSGNPEAVHLPVHYPQLANTDIEQETFKWFVDNAGEGKNYEANSQFLASIEYNSTALPGLSRKPRRKPQTNNR